MSYDSWMIAGAALAYALVAPVVLWLFSDKTSDRVALSALAMATSLYLAVMGLESTKTYVPGINNFMLDLPPKAFGQFTMLTAGYRSGAYSAATTVAMVCMVILIWDRWNQQKNYRTAFMIAAGAMGFLACLTYVGPLFYQLFITAERGIADFFLALADIAFLAWAFVVIARSEAIQRFLSRVPEQKT